MVTLAGQMDTGIKINPQWVPCDGKFYYTNDPKQPKRTPVAGTAGTGTRWDYIRRVGHWGRSVGVGLTGWLIRVPYDPSGTWKVSLADDTTEANLTNPPTVQNPPAGVR